MPQADPPPADDNMRVALVTGGHTFSVPALYEAFYALLPPGAAFYPQALDEFSADPTEAGRYDVVLFYTMHRVIPDEADRLPWYQKRFFDTLDALRPEQGVGVLHHGLVAFPDWPLWSELVGIEDRKQITPHFDQSVEVMVADAAHPITRGLPPVWTLHDETYVMAEPAPESGNHPLLTTAHARSMKTLAWTRTFRGGRVFCWQAGHDHHAFGDPHFRRVLANAVRWLAGRDDEDDQVAR
jgi:hypothetical protein